MKAYEIECSGEIHELGIDGEGVFHLFDHDIEEEEAVHMLGEEPSECFQLVTALSDDPDKVLLNSTVGSNFKLLRPILAAGADPNVGDGIVLLQALHNEDWEAAELLLEYGADPNIGDGWLLLNLIHGIIAGEFGTLEAIQFLVEAALMFTLASITPFWML